jgi:hypothetical protein
MPPNGPATGVTCSYFSRRINPRKPSSYSPNDTARSNSGAESRQCGQRPSPISNRAEASRSPQITHCGARVGKISAMHSRQTGTRETLFSELRQSLQLDGKRTETIPGRSCKGARNKARGCARKFRRVRVSVSRLLKTTLRLSQESPPERSHVAGARGSGERWLTPLRTRSTVTDQYMWFTMSGAMLEEVPVWDSQRFHYRNNCGRPCSSSAAAKAAFYYGSSGTTKVRP